MKISLFWNTFLDFFNREAMHFEELWSTGWKLLFSESYGIVESLALLLDVNNNI